MQTIQEILSAIEFTTGLDLIKLGQQVKAHGGLSIFGTDIWFPDGTASRPLSVDSDKKISFAGAAGTPITGSGTANTLPKFTALTVIGDSRISDDGTDVTINNNGITAKLKLSNQTGSNTSSIYWDYTGTNNDMEIKYTPGITAPRGTLDFLFNNLSSLKIQGGQTTNDLIQMGAPASMSGVEGAVKIRPSPGGYNTIFVLQQEAIGVKPFMKCLDSSGTLLSSINLDGGATFPNLSLSDTPLAVSSGGTGATTFTANALILGNTTSALSSLALGTANRVLGMNSGATAHEYKDLLGTTNQITATHAANSITFSAPQNLHTSADFQVGTLGIGIAGDATSQLKMSKVTPEMRMIESGGSAYTRIYKQQTTNTAQRYNQQIKQSGTGYAVNFVTGGNDQMTAASAVSNFASTQDHTYAFWFYPTANNTNTTNLIDFGGSSAGGGTGVAFYFPAAGSHQINFYYNNSAVTYSAAGIFTLNTWHHIAVSYNQSTQAVKIYKNGTHVNGSQSASGSWSSRSFTILFGKSGTLGNRVPDGYLDEVKIYNSLLSDGDVSTDYNSGNGRYGQASDTGILYGYHVDEGAGTTAASYATALNMTLASANWVTGKVASSASTVERSIWKMVDGVDSNEGGVLTIGDTDIQTKLNYGTSLRAVANATEMWRTDTVGMGIKSTSPSSYLTLGAGTTAANTAPLKFTSGSLNTTAEAGAVEFLTDKWYATITTGAARKEFTLNDAALTSGRVPYATTNGRLTDSANLTFDGSILTVANLKDSGLTSGRVTYATTSGQLTDNSGFTFDGTTLTIPDLAVDGGTLQVDHTNNKVGVNVAPHGNGTLALQQTGNTADEGLTIIDSTAATATKFWRTGGAGTKFMMTDRGADTLALDAGTVYFGTHSAIGAETVTGYITIKDIAGNTRKLAVVS